MSVCRLYVFSRFFPPFCFIFSDSLQCAKEKFYERFEVNFSVLSDFDTSHANLWDFCFSVLYA